jgi:Zn-dependent protease with chaperone function
MKGKLVFASTITIGILLSFVFFIVLLASYVAGLISAFAMVFFTIVINLVLWLISPWITDLIHKLFYKFEFIELSDLAKRSPKTAQFLKEACERNDIPLPMLRIVKDLNPTAYCYGSYPGNSRLVVSEGLFHYLDDEEVAAVYGHELGHIKNLDFIVMTVANTLLMILYEMYVIFTRMRGKNNPLPLIGLVSLVFWFIGSYLVLYLSRTREFMADRFAGVETKNPNALASALVKIAYGIAAQPDTAESKRLLASTRAMGITDYKGAETVGGAVSLTSSEKETGKKPVPAFDPRRISKVFLFDVYNPWAKIVQLGSTHPLTGKRIKALMELAGEMGTAQLFNFDEIALDGQALDRGRLYGKFFLEVLIYFAPILGLVLGGILALLHGSLLGIIILLWGIGLLIKGIYKFPPLTEPDDATVLELMSDPYASPLKGRPVSLGGVVIGRASAGSIFGEDVVIHDPSGGLMTLNYESVIPLFGNLFFGYTKAKKLINQRIRGVGWFRRKVNQVVDLKTLETGTAKIKSFNRFRALFFGVIVVVVGFIATIITIASFAASVAPPGQSAF